MKHQKNKGIGSLKSYVIDFFSKGHERTLLAKKNITASFVIKIFSVLINLALVPITIDYVNPTQYGIWLTLTSIIAWFSFFDIGFGHGLRNKFAESKAKGDFYKARVYVSTTYATLFIIFSSAWIMFFVLNHFLDWSRLLNATPEISNELSILALIVFSFFCLQMVLRTINTVIVADQRPALVSFFDMIGQLIALTTIIILIKTTNGSLIYLGLGLGSAPLIILIITTLLFFSKRYKYLKPSLKFVKFNYARDIMGLGIKFFIIQFSAIFVFQTTNIIVSHLLGSEQVTVYNIGYKYFFLIHTLTSLIVAPFWSAFTEAYSKNDFTWMKNIESSLNRTWYFILLIIVIMFLISNFVYRIWIGDVVIVPISVSFFLALNVVASTRFAIYSVLINGIGKINLQLYLNVLLSVVYIPITIVLGKYFGLNGIIISNIIISTIYAILTPIQLDKILSNNATGIWNK